MPPAIAEVLERYAELASKVDRFFAHVAAGHGDAMQCAAGCAECCHTRFSITLVEARVLARGLAAMPAAARARLADRAVHGSPGRCAALGDDERCEIYALRPLVCRSHGVPVRRREAAGDDPVPDRVRLPIIDVCHLNFTGDRLGAVEPIAILDQLTLSTVLAGLETALAAAEQRAPGRRVELAEILADPAQTSG